VPAAGRPGALHAVGLGRLKPSVLNAVMPGWGRPGSVTLADPGSPGGNSGYQAVMSLSCAAAGLPAGTNALTGLNTLAEQEFTAINSSNAQLGQTTVDGRTAVLVYNQMSVGTATVTGDREQPKVMYIVPWKKSDIGDLTAKPMNSLVDEILAPVDRDVFKREVIYYRAVESTSQNGAPPKPAPQGEK